MPGNVVQEKEKNRKATSNPTTTLFIVNFDVHRVRERDVERHFEEFGRLRRVEIKKNYAFVQVIPSGWIRVTWLALSWRGGLKTTCFRQQQL